MNKIENQGKQPAQEMSIDTIVSHAMLQVTAIVGDLCRVLRAQAVDAQNLRSINETLSQQLSAAAAGKEKSK
jgi:hypothetical protein